MLRGIWTAVEQNVLDHLRGIDNAHVHASGAHVVETSAVERATHGLVATEAECDVAHASADLAAGAHALDLARRVDEVDGVFVVLSHARADREDVRVEHDLVVDAANLLHEDLVRALAHAHLVLGGRRTRLRSLVVRE